VVDCGCDLRVGLGEGEGECGAIGHTRILECFEISVGFKRWSGRGISLLTF
jgi:hypothetical protein